MSSELIEGNITTWFDVEAGPASFFVLLVDVAALSRSEPALC